MSILIQNYKNNVRIFNLYKLQEDFKFEYDTKFVSNIDLNEIKEIEHDIKFSLTELCDGMPAGICRICYQLQYLIIKKNKSYIFCKHCCKSISEFIIN